MAAIPATIFAGPEPLAFSKLKAHMKRLAARTVDTLWKGVGEILELFSKQECANFFAASGYGGNALEALGIASDDTQLESCGD